MNIPIEEVEAKLLEKHFDPVKVQEVIRELEEIAEELKEENQAAADVGTLPADPGADVGAKIKWEHVIILNDKEGYLKDKEIAGWVVQQEENADAGLIVGKLKDAAKSQNETAKRKKNAITDLVGLFESLKSKFAKEKKVRIKTKELTRVLITNGKF